MAEACASITKLQLMMMFPILGAAVPLNPLMAYAQFPLTEIDGYNPYRLAKETMAIFQIGFVMTKGMPWNKEIDATLGRILEAG